MENILRVCYYGVSVCALPLVLLFWLGNLLGPGQAGETWRHKAILLGSGAAAMGLFYWSYRMGQGQGQWLGALLLSVAAPVVFAVLTLGGLILFTNIRWN
jgi:hypothetical protein